MFSRTRSGFSLRDVIVAIGVLFFVFLGLALYFVNMARENARQRICLSNMRQVGLALQNFESRERGATYPGYKTYLNTKNGSYTAPSFSNCPYPVSMQGQEVAVSWIVELFPYLDQSGPRSNWKTQQTEDQGSDCAAAPGDTTSTNFSAQFLFPFIDLIVCPSDPPQDVDRASISIVVNTGMRDGMTPGARDFRENGMFHDHYTDYLLEKDPSHPRTLLIRTTSAYIDRRGDGLQYTLMLSENVDAGSYLDTDERFLGFTWSKPSDPVNLIAKPPTMNPRKNVRRINEGIGRQKSVIEDPSATNRGVSVDAAGNYTGLEDSDDEVFYYARPSSYHPGGVNVVFCDGHGQFLSDKIDYYVYIMLMTPFGGGVKDPHNHGEPITDPGFANQTNPPPKFDERWLTQ